MSTRNGSFVWYELMTSDADAAAGFYAKVVGWTPEDSGMSETTGMEYTILKAADVPAAGLMKQPEDVSKAGAPPSWICYIAVDDVDAYAERISGMGGAVHRAPADIPGVGRFAVVADPHGAMFCLFKGEGEPPAANVEPGTPGHAGWHELMAGDGAAAYDFYAGLFGWTKGEAMDMGPMGIYQIFEIDGVAAGGIMTKPAEMPFPTWNCYFNVESIDAAAKRISAAGGEIVHGPMEVPGGSWILHGKDPQGGFFALVGPEN
ncbi:VOC family protein [Rhizobiales bacterium]|uniref:VOC family protein n=1 Tax=Hongsoonwoonella zoysiae TaxID=2821844 RepID=UPI00156077A8|nr:VOC family protein [Hongsoonwoonella zoysiae]NRG17655.1 VOC family protein [Hongsoonwoonella zoysiae]